MTRLLATPEPLVSAVDEPRPRSKLPPVALMVRIPVPSEVAFPSWIQAGVEVVSNVTPPVNVLAPASETVLPTPLPPVTFKLPAPETTPLNHW